MWLHFCTGIALFLEHIFLEAALGAFKTASSIRKEKKDDVDAGCAFVHREFYSAHYNFLLCHLFFSFLKITLRLKFIISFVRVFLFHVCEYSTSSLELVSKVILGSLTNIPALLSAFLYAHLLLMTVTAQQLLLVVFKVLLLFCFFSFKQNRTVVDKCSMPLNQAPAEDGA